MESLEVHPQDINQMQAIKAFLKALNIPFESMKSKKSPYNPEFVKKIKESQQQVKEGKVKNLSMEELAKRLNIEEDV